MSKKPKRIRRTFSDEFKQDAVNLVVKQGYSFAAAAKAVDVASRSLRECQFRQRFPSQPSANQRKRVHVGSHVR